VRIGKLNLGDLKEGEIRQLNAKEIAALLNNNPAYPETSLIK
jgi:16S rRNA U516 pseudouridylate synthase RsuA-like enzyme